MGRMVYAPRNNSLKVVYILLAAAWCLLLGPKLNSLGGFPRKVPLLVDGVALLIHWHFVVTMRVAHNVGGVCRDLVV
jgi:hypothetical protein